VSHHFLVQKDPRYPNAFYFYSCFTNKVLQVGIFGHAQTVNCNKLAWERMIVERAYPDPQGSFKSDVI
jgi:hypothetical protein